MNICPKCGLPLQACVCGEIAKSDQRITVTTLKKKFGKIATRVNGFDNSVDTKEIAKQLKIELACGGTVKEGVVELQGDHSKRIKQVLISLGFKAEQISD
jgi:translation initiation factor 1